MKRLQRNAAPGGFGGQAEELEQRRSWYGDLRDEQGKIRSRWSDDSLRRALEEQGDGCCAWCRVRLEPGWEVDHYLPKARFPRLAYCWEDLLPSCPTCNKQRKGRFSPPSLREDSLVDPALSVSEQTEDRCYVPGQVLPLVTDRLVDPSFEEPADHLRFEPVLHGYVSSTSVGERTVKQLFAQKDLAQRWERLGAHVRWCVEQAGSLHELQQGLSTLAAFGFDVHVRAYASCWIALLRPGWLASPEAESLSHRPAAASGETGVTSLGPSGVVAAT